MDCNAFVELVTAYLDGSLDPETRMRVDTHLLECDGCTEYLRQFRTTVDALGRVDEGATVDPALRDRLVRAFRQWR